VCYENPFRAVLLADIFSFSKTIKYHWPDFKVISGAKDAVGEAKWEEFERELDREKLDREFERDL
jgi:hypothetical protein